MNMKNTKKRIPAMIMAAGLVGMATVLALALVTGCASSPKKQAKEAKKDMKLLSYANQPNGELELTNETNYDLVIFAGKISRNNILGGIKASSTRSFDFRQFVSGKTGAFLVRAVKVETYEENGGHITETNDVVFAKLVTFGNLKSSFRISGEIGGDGTLLFENMSPYPVEIRLNNVTGEVLTTLPPYCKEQYVYIKPNKRGYVYYPTYLMYNKEKGQIDSIIGKDEDGQAARPAEGNETPQTVIFPMPNSKMYGTKVAYLTIRNESGRAFIFRNDNTEIFSQNGYTMVNSGETLTFEVESTENGTEFRALNVDFRVGSEKNRFVKLFGGQPTTLKAGVEYTISVFNENGLVKTEIQNTSEREVDYDLPSQLELE